MPIVGFSFEKIHVERKKPVKGKIDINNNMKVVEIEDRDLSFSKGQSGVNFKFDFSTNYEPDIGSINFTGEVIFMDEEKNIKHIIDEWKKNKKVDKGLMSQILNHALMKCNIQALVLSQEINLPPPIMLPKVKIEGMKE